MSSAIDFLRQYVPSWRDGSFMIPLSFPYKKPDMSDEDFQKYIDTHTSINYPRHISDRKSEIHKRDIYDTIQELTKNESLAPFISIYQLKTLEAFDFVLFGKTFGIVVIEVRISNYARSKHFKSGNQHLPKNYKEGLNILQAADSLSAMLHKGTNRSIINPINITKILYTPNLERQRFNEWVDSLADEGRYNVKNKIGSIIQWFQGEVDLEKAIECSCNFIDTQVYKEYVLYLTSIKMTSE